MNFKYIAGDFPDGTKASAFGLSSLTIPTESVWKPEILEFKGNIQSLDILTEDNKISLLSKVGWGIIGSALGPAGTLAGLLLAGKKKEVAFVCHLKDGRKFMGTCDPETYKKLLSFSF